MAVNLASKYADKLAKRFRLKSLTEIACGASYSWAGVKTVTVKTIASQALGDYSRTGSDRYGAVSEVQDTIQDMAITKDRGKTLTIDKGNYKQGGELVTSAETVAMQMDEVYTPEVDTYRLGVMLAAATANSMVNTVAITASNAYDQFLASQVKLDDKLVTSEGRVCFATPSFIKFIKQDVTAVNNASDKGQTIKFNGMIGELDGVKLVKVPSGRMPANTAFIIMHPSVFCGPEQVNEANVHIDPPGISGVRIDMRFIYDAFVLDARKDGIAAHKIA